jgi:hypothetical protein
MDRALHNDVRGENLAALEDPDEATEIGQASAIQSNPCEATEGDNFNTI